MFWNIITIHRLSVLIEWILFSKTKQKQNSICLSVIFIVKSLGIEIFNNGTVQCWFECYFFSFRKQQSQFWVCWITLVLWELWMMRAKKMKPHLHGMIYGKVPSGNKKWDINWNDFSRSIPIFYSPAFSQIFWELLIVQWWC